MKIQKINAIDKTNGVVISQVRDCKDTIDEVLENCGAYTSCIIVSLMEETNPLNGTNPNIKAVARCTGGDEFTTERGLDVANTKADLKYHKRMVRDYDKYIARMKKAIEDVEALRKAHVTKVDVITKSMEEFYQ